MLAHNPEFRYVSAEHLAELARHGRRRMFSSGKPLMKQGEQSDSLHVLVKGHVKVERENRAGDGSLVLLAELGPGDIVGEMGVLLNQPRNATVTALEAVETLQLNAGFLNDILEQEPDVLVALTKVINERLKSPEAVIENVY